MKKNQLTAILMLLGYFANAQELKSIDSTLKNINKNLEKIIDNVVSEEPVPYTGSSIFEDKNGSSAIFLPYGGTVKINTGDASLQLSLVNYSPPVKTERSAPNYEFKPFYGIELLEKTNDGILPLISNGNISPGARANGIIGKDLFLHFTKEENQVLGTLIFKVGYEGSSFKLYNPDLSFSDQIKNIYFNTITSSLSFNLKIAGNKAFGASVGYQKVNNYMDLDELEFTDVKTISDSASGTKRIYENKIRARTGDYEIADQVPVNIDFFWVPKNDPRVGLYHYWRTKLTDEKITNGFGSGLYLLKKNNPLASVAGIVFDVSDIEKLKTGFSKNFTISLIVGYNFDFTRRH